jgi:EAL domain-containing protein (putative c-di-GMP-specific phosphodiesterase class I)
MSCQRCQGAPAPVARRGTLYITTPLAHTATKIRRYAQDAALSLFEPHPDVLALPFAPGGMARFIADLPNLLSSVELQDCKSVVLADDEALTFARLMQAQSLDGLLARADGDWLLSMIAENRLTFYFQPIVNAQTPDQIFAYEALIRGRAQDGSLVYPGRILSVAKAADLLFNLDSAARRTAVLEAAAHSIQTNLFINFTPTSIYDPKNCLRTTMAAIERSGITPDRIIFEVVEGEHVADVNHLLDIFSFYRSNGFRVALDDLGAGYSSMNLLAQLRPDFVKLDMGLIRDVDREPYKAHIARKLIEMAQELEVFTIAEGVETEGEYQWLQAHRVDYVQGYLFAKPASPPPLPKVPALIAA